MDGQDGMYFNDSERIGPEKGRLRVLVADDNKDWVEGLSIVLKMQGYDLRCADNGLEAVEICEKFHPDVAIIDIGMPGLNGYEVARRLRREQWAVTTFLIAASGWGQPQDKKDAADAGFNVHMTKPLDLDALKILLADTAIKLQKLP